MPALVPAQVRKHRPIAIFSYANYAVRYVPHAVRAPGTREYRVKVLADERDVGDAAHERSQICARLARRQVIDDRRAHAVAVDL